MHGHRKTDTIEITGEITISRKTYFIPFGCPIDSCTTGEQIIPQFIFIAFTSWRPKGIPKYFFGVSLNLFMIWALQG